MMSEKQPLHAAPGDEDAETLKMSTPGKRPRSGNGKTPSVPSTPHTSHPETLVDTDDETTKRPALRPGPQSSASPAIDELPTQELASYRAVSEDKSTSQAPAPPEFAPTNQAKPPVSRSYAPRAQSYIPWQNRRGAGKAVAPPEPQKQSAPVRVNRVSLFMVLALLILLVGGVVLLWRDIDDTHLYLATLNARDGQIMGWQDLGGGYRGSASITPPAQAQGAFVYGVHSSQGQQLLTIQEQGSGADVLATSTDPSSGADAALASASGGYLVAESASGVQVITPAGKQLWQLQAEQPHSGAHPFQPAFDATTLYAAQSVAGQIAAYGLRDGAVRWTRDLGDPLDYAPPLLLNGGTLFVASDTRLYALNSADGSILWQETRPTRTLSLLITGQGTLLLSAGTQGLAALDPSNGRPVWTFTGPSGGTSLTSPQFYQATVTGASAGTMVYATGIVWDEQQVRAQLWLYAVDGATGIARWSERVSSDMLAVDAGRTITPLVDAANGLVILQQVQDSGACLVTAFDTQSGTRRWNVSLPRTTVVAPALVRTSDGLLLPVTSADSALALREWSVSRVLLLVIAGLSLLGLMFFLIRAFQSWLRQPAHTVPRLLISPLKVVVRLWRASRIVFALMLLAVLIGAGWLGYIQLNQPRSSQYQVNAATGSVQWRSLTAAPAQTLVLDTQGSLSNVDSAENLHQLIALNNSGSRNWTSFGSEGAFSLPDVGSQTGTLLVALSGHVSLHYRFAPDDPAYVHPLDRLLNFYLLSRDTGQIIWQRTITAPDAPQKVAVLGGDAKFIYLASSQSGSAPATSNSATRLLAIDRQTGNAVWQFTGPSANDLPFDSGRLLIQRQELFWQAAGNIYAIDALSGRQTWRQVIPFENPGSLFAEEQQMTIAAGYLFIPRDDTFHGLNPQTGQEGWILPNPAIAAQFNISADVPQGETGILGVGHTVLVYGGGQIVAMDATTRGPIWSQKQVDSILGLQVSDDDKTLYAVLVESIEGSPPAQAIVAFDMRSGGALWTFQPVASLAVVHIQTGGFQYHHGTLFTAICFPGASGVCAHERLYALDGETGRTLWKVEATHVFDVRIRADGGEALFQVDSSAFEEFVQQFKG